MYVYVRQFPICVICRKTYGQPPLTWRNVRRKGNLMGWWELTGPTQQDNVGREAPWFHHRGRAERDVLCKSGPEFWLEKLDRWITTEAGKRSDTPENCGLSKFGKKFVNFNP